MKQHSQKQIHAQQQNKTTNEQKQTKLMNNTINK